MSIHPSPEFRHGYEYASQVYDRMMAQSSIQEIQELASILSEGPYADNEAARGMAAYCRELARERQGR
jgi:hypothetical protein